MKKRQIAIAAFWIFWVLTFDYVFYGLGYQRGQKAFIINRYPEAGLECGCRADPVPNPNPVRIFDGHTYNTDICKSPLK